MSEAIALLRSLAEIEAELHRLARRVAELVGEEERLRARLTEADQAFVRRKEEHRRLRLAAQERVAEADATDAKIREYQRKLDHDIIPYKEMEFLREQIQILRAKLDQLSEEALFLMEAVEEDAKKLQEDEESYRRQRERLESEIGALQSRRGEIKEEEERAEVRRQELVAQLPPQLRQHYEKLRARVPNPVVYVNGESCGGCHLRLSEATLLKLQEGREVVTCEHCSRFLVLPWG